MLLYHIAIKLITICSKYNGKIFGGFVRDVLVPNYLHIPPVIFNDIDLWFKNMDDADNFVKEMKLELVDEEHGKFIWKKYKLDIIISNFISNEDFSIHYLTYDMNNGFMSFSDTYTKEELIQQISQKQMIALPTLFKQDENVYKERIKKFLTAGWKIMKI